VLIDVLIHPSIHPSIHLSKRVVYLFATFGFGFALDGDIQKRASVQPKEMQMIEVDIAY